MDPLSPITPGGPSVPARRVPPVDRLRKITREGEEPKGKEREQRKRREPGPAYGPVEGDGGEGRVDVRV
jgi:hypothetical protein